MSLIDRLFGNKKAMTTASIAKERLQLIVAHERGMNSGHSHADYLPALQQELIAVIRKYVSVEQDQVHVALDNDGDRSVLELNVTLGADR